MIRSIESIALGMRNIKESLYADVSNCEICIVEKDKCVNISINTNSDKYCSVFASATDGVFDISFANMVCDSDIRHDEFDVNRMILSAVSGNIIIEKSIIYRMTSEVKAILLECGNDYFSVRDIRIPFLNKFSRKRLFKYDSYIRKQPNQWGA